MAISSITLKVIHKIICVF